MELKQIKELMAAMDRSNIQKLKLKKDNFEIELERSLNSDVESLPLFESNVPSGHEQAMRRASAAFSKATESNQLLSGANQGSNTEKDTSSIYVTSPMVGTFYTGPSPEEPPFAQIGDKIEKNSIVCIIEAMKVMNEVKAGVAGTVAEILVENGQPVEFGTKLFRII